jgi:hypothetical protein
MQQMMRAVEEADRRIRAEHGAAIQQDKEQSGVFETMRDMPQAPPETYIYREGESTP